MQAGQSPVLFAASTAAHHTAALQLVQQHLAAAALHSLQAEYLHVVLDAVISTAAGAGLLSPLDFVTFTSGAVICWLE